jgi:RNA polymerase sigma-70 factor (ECF subfamily)
VLPPTESPPRPRVSISSDLVRAHQAGVWRYLRFVGAPQALADDLTQETFLALLTHAPEDRGPDALAGWLRTTARRLFLNQRKRGRLQVGPDFDEFDAVWQEYVGVDDGTDYIAAVRGCLAALPEEDARAILMRYRDDAGRDAIGAALGISVEGVKTRLRRIKERLRLCVARRVRNDD